MTHRPPPACRSVFLALRPHNGLALGGLFLLARLSVRPDLQLADLLGASGLWLLSCSAHLVNDLLDWLPDRTNRPGRPLPQGSVVPSQLRPAAVSTWLAGLLVGWASVPELGFWWVLWSLAGPGYSLLAKGHGWVAPLWAATLVASCWLGPALAAGPQNWRLGVGAAIFYFILFRECVKLQADLRGDLQAGYWNPTGRIPARCTPWLVLASPLVLGLAWLCRHPPGAATSGLAVGMILVFAWVVLRQGNRVAGGPHLSGSLLKVNSFLGLAILLDMLSGN